MMSIAIQNTIEPDQKGQRTSNFRLSLIAETALKEVVQTFRNETEEWVHITVNGEKITCTPEHPFYVPQKGWTSVIDLRAGDILVMLNGEYVVVELVQHELLESPETTYNFEVKDFHTYYVGEENIVMAQVHFYEDTPHLQAYFLPVVNEVKRKCYQRDKDGNLIKEIKKDRNGKDKEVPILLRDKNGEMVYETVKGNFLNNDQFWKDLGGRNSFSKLQDRFNKYITSKGFNLDRGEIGANKYHQTKLEYHINELKAEEKKLNKDLNNYKDKINEAKNVLETSLRDTNSDLKKKIIGYSKKEVEKLMDDFDNLTRLNTIKTYESKDKDDKITSLSIENDFYKNNRKLIKSEKIRHEQSKELSNKDEELKYYKNAFSKVTRALDIITKRRPMPYIHNYVSFAESVMAGKRAREMDEEAQREFDEANKKGEDIWL